MLNPTVKASHKFSENSLAETLTTAPGPNPACPCQLRATGRGRRLRGRSGAESVVQPGSEAPCPGRRSRAEQPRTLDPVILAAADDPVSTGIIFRVPRTAAVISSQPQPSEDSRQVRIWERPRRCHRRRKREALSRVVRAPALRPRPPHPRSTPVSPVKPRGGKKQCATPLYSE